MYNNIQNEHDGNSHHHKDHNVIVEEGLESHVNSGEIRHKHKKGLPHGHSHNYADFEDESDLKKSIYVTLLFFITEVVGGLISNSLTLLGDAFHMLRDVAALIISLAALRISRKGSTREKTFGYHRVEILAAFLNAVALLVISGWMMLEAYDRLKNGVDIDAKWMLIVGVVGLVANLYGIIKLRGKDNLNLRSAFLHMLTDTLSSVVVVIGALVIIFTGYSDVDSILSFFLSSFIIYSTVGVVRESAEILLEFTPRDVDIDVLKDELEEVPEIIEIHDLHVWALTNKMNVATMHVLTEVESSAEQEVLKSKIRKILESYDIVHSTLELECSRCQAAEDSLKSGNQNGDKSPSFCIERHI